MKFRFIWRVTELPPCAELIKVLASRIRVTNRCAFPTGAADRVTEHVVKRFEAEECMDQTGITNVNGTSPRWPRGHCRRGNSGCTNGRRYRPSLFLPRRATDFSSCLSFLASTVAALHFHALRLAEFFGLHSKGGRQRCFAVVWHHLEAEVDALLPRRAAPPCFVIGICQQIALLRRL